MEQELIDVYDAARDFRGKPFRSACYAPFVSMVFDSIGRVRACCVNFEHILGDIRTQRIDEIWSGAPMERLRLALKNYDFSHGCGYCYFKISEGSFDGKNFSNTLLQTFKYEEYAVEAEGPFHPKHLEFHMSNACNLECVMCHGEFSSAIRSRREKLPPIPKAYDDQFFEDLRKYLPKIENANFLGGEPFLIKEQFRVWDMFIEDGLKPGCHVTTNGTQYNAKVERVLENLPVSITISMDGVTKETFEKIRLNANYEEVLENIQRFHEYSRKHGRRVCFSFTLSLLNWHEFGDFLLFADGWEGFVSVSTLFSPEEMSLHALSKEELSRIVEHMERQERTILPKLTLNRQVWINYLKELRHRLTHLDQVVFGGREEPKIVEIAWGDVANGLATDASPLPMAEVASSGGKTSATFSNAEKRKATIQKDPALVDYFVGLSGMDEPVDAIAEESQLRRLLMDWARTSSIDSLICDREDRIERIDAEGGRFLRVSRDCTGENTNQIYALLMESYGKRVETVSVDVQERVVDRIVAFEEDSKPRTLIRSIALPRFSDDGGLVGTKILAAIQACT